MQLHHLNPDGLHAIPTVLSHAVVVPELRLVYLSGQVAWDGDGELVGGDDHGLQAEQIVRNIETALVAAGTDRSHVVKETIYVARYRPEIVGPIFDALRKGAPTPPPAQTLLGVASLYAPEVLVEIDIVAVLP